MTTLSDFLTYLLGCRHVRRSNPFTPGKVKRFAVPPAARVTGTYVTCLDCGHEIPYDLELMKTVKMPRRRFFRAVLPLGGLK